MDDFPKELLMEILSRLPVESLVRFKCVCKSWYVLLESPKFVSEHIARQCEDHVILMHNTGGNFMSFLPIMDNYGDDVSCIVDSDLDLKHPFQDRGYWHLFLHGYCDGMVLLTDFDEVTMVCNPAIRKIRVLPVSRTLLQHIAGQNPLLAENSSVGFGYDPKTGDYKVIRVMAFWADEDHDFELPHRAEVFSLYADSSWREIEGVVGAQLFRGEDLEQYFDGVHYWIGIDKDTQKRVMVSFDMSDEVFQKAPILDVCDPDENVLSLGVLRNESISLFVWPKDGIEKCIDVWVMKEFGVKESWTKQLTIGPLLGLHRPLVFWKNGKELLQENEKGELASYNLATLESKKLRVHHEVWYLMLWRAYLYKKTLVSVNKRKNNTF